MPATLRGTEEVQLSSSLTRVMGTLAVVVAIVAVANVASAWYLDSHTSNRGYWLVKHKWSLLAALTEPVDLLVVGDSSCNQGLDSALLEAELGSRSINLCTVGNVGAVDDLWMTEEYIARFGPPAAVLVIHVYDVWHRDADGSLLAQIPRPGLIDNQDLVALGGRTLLRYLVAKYARLYAEDKTLKAFLMRPWRAQTAFSTDARGFMPVESSDPERVVRDRLAHSKFAARNEFRLSSQSQRALARLTALAEQHGFQIFLANAPTSEALFADVGFQTYFDDAQRALAAVAAQSERVTHLDRRYPFADEVMTNADHLTVEGSAAYTRQIAEEIRRRR